VWTIPSLDAFFLAIAGPNTTMSEMAIWWTTFARP
jgi:hypothetical protein